MKKLVEIYTAADVFVNPSVEETMGLTTVEALACGTPAIIVYNATAVLEMIDVSCGIVVEKGDIEKLNMELKGNRIKQIKTDSCIKKAQLYEKKEIFSEYIRVYSMLSVH